MPRIRRLSPALWVTCIFALSLRSANAQLSHCLPVESDSARAVNHAPVLRFQESERYYPTVPFFTAFFDGNGEPRDTAFFRVDEIAPLGDDKTKASWSQLTTAYDGVISEWRGKVSRKPPMTAAFYRVRHEVDEKQLWRFLRSDGQAWDRHEMDAFLTRFPESTEFTVVEYYFYYVRDVGLTGHPEDIEFVFLFMPKERDLSCVFQIMVGAGHESRQPNNVLVSLQSPSVRGQFQNGVIVELGGHASAPDLDNDGRFVLGHDINWGLENVWGVRDLLSVAGTGFAGDYRSDLTLPRNHSRFWVPPRRWGQPGYALIPGGALEELEGRLARGVDSRLVAESLGELASYLEVEETPQTLSEEQLSRLSTWARDLDGGKGGHRFWAHEVYRDDAHRILKQHLYRTWSWWRNWIFVYDARQDPGTSVRFGARFPAPTLLGLRLPGIFESTVGLQRDRTSVDLLYEASFADLWTWFLSVRWDDSRTALGRDPRWRDRLWLTAGPTLVLYIAGKPRLLNLWTGIGGLRIRTGPTIDFHQLTSGIREVGWTLSVAVR